MLTLEDFNEFLKKHVEDFFNDEYRLSYHLMSPYGWMNDPHNPVFHNEKYHIFCNLNPFKTEPFDAKSWAHIVSDNMIDFTYLPCVIAPDSEQDKSGCASGCVVLKDEKMYLIYTAKNFDRTPKEVQCLAISSDGVHFEKFPENPILVGTPVTWENCRDPRVWDENGIYYMLLGNSFDGHGRILIFSSKDLINWSDEGVFCESIGEQGFMWECPDYFKINDKHILILSPEGMGDMRHRTIYLTGDLDRTKKRFIQSNWYELDSGFDFYAPQTFSDKDGNRVLIAWMDKWFAEMPTEKKGWVGSVTIPRILNVNEKGFLEMHPIEELKSLRKEGFQKSGLEVFENENVLSGLRSVQFELRFNLDLRKATAKVVELYIRESEDKKQYTRISFNLKSDVVTFDKRASGEGSKIKQDVKLKYSTKKHLDVVIYVDTTSIEILINNGTTSITHRIYPERSSNLMSLYSEDGKLCFSNLEYYTLKNNTVKFNYGAQQY